MIVRTPTGEIVTGDTFTAIVSEMAREKLRKPRALSSYRRATARRCAAAGMGIVDPASDESFVLSLVQIGLAEIIISA